MTLWRDHFYLRLLSSISYMACWNISYEFGKMPPRVCLNPMVRSLDPTSSDERAHGTIATLIYDGPYCAPEIFTRGGNLLHKTGIKWRLFRSVFEVKVWLKELNPIWRTCFFNMKALFNVQLSLLVCNFDRFFQLLLSLILLPDSPQSHLQSRQPSALLVSCAGIDPPETSLNQKQK